MAENDQEKTEHQSQKKLEQSREKGELPRSQELGTFVVFTLFLLFVGVNRLGWFDGLGAIMADMLQFDKYMNLDRRSLGEFLLIPIARTIGLISPPFLIILVLSPLVWLAQSGFNFAKEKLAPDWNRLNPVNGFGRIFSRHQVVEGVKSTFKIGLFGWLAWTAVRKNLPSIQVMGTVDLRGQLHTMLDVAMSIGIRIAIVMGLLAILDYGYQWWEFHKKLLLTHQELKDEMKERDGNPLIRQRQRSLQMQAARRRMTSDIAKASVVVTNPTHYAVALSYDRLKAPAPYVCAKGRDFMALHIRKIAMEHGVPVIENRPLARALYRETKVGQLIPNQFYKAVAELLAFVFWLKRRKGAAPRRSLASVGRLVTALDEQPAESLSPDNTY